ncbi:hypothetical protein P7K49_023480, partial [Saguinus oedipus]
MKATLLECECEPGAAAMHPSEPALLPRAAMAWWVWSGGTGTQKIPNSLQTMLMEFSSDTGLR